MILKAIELSPLKELLSLKGATATILFSLARAAPITIKAKRVIFYENEIILIALRCPLGLSALSSVQHFLIMLNRKCCKLFASCRARLPLPFKKRLPGNTGDLFQ